MSGYYRELGWSRTVSVWSGKHNWTMLMPKILQNHLLCAKIDAIYLLYPESFCYKNVCSLCLKKKDMRSIFRSIKPERKGINFKVVLLWICFYEKSLCLNDFLKDTLLHRQLLWRSFQKFSSLLPARHHQIDLCQPPMEVEDEFWWIRMSLEKRGAGGKGNGRSSGTFDLLF